MNEPVKKITFWVNKKEFKLFEQACLYGADPEQIINKAVEENGKYRISLSYDDLEELSDYLFHCVLGEKNRQKQNRFEKLCSRIEKLGRLAYKSQKKKSGYYIFDVWLWGDKECTTKKKIVRKLRLTGNSSLNSFARAIIKSFGFDFDHCFGFYDSLKLGKEYKKAYELFVDLGEEPTCSNAKSVKETSVSQAFESPGEKLIFLFDYGDAWQFNVELIDVLNIEPDDLEPMLLESVGKAPLQYPSCEEEE